MPPDDGGVGRAARLFDSLSATYDAVGVDLFGPVADALVERLAPTSGESLLDIGCGTGQVLLRMSHTLQSWPRMLGIDISPGMLAQARILLDAAGLDHVQLRMADAQDPQLGNERFDVIASSLVLFFLPDPLSALRSWRRLLFPGGRVGIATFGARDARWEEIDSVFAPFLPESMLDARTSGAIGPFSSEEGLIGLFRDAGFGRVSNWTSEVEVTFRDPDHWHTWTMSVGQRAMWAMVPPEHVLEVRNLATERLSRCRGDDGLIHFTQAVRTTVGR